MIGVLPLPLPWPFEREYMQLALAAGLVVGVCAPLLGTFLVQKRLALFGDGVGHLAFAGVAAGLLLGVWPVATALVVAAAGAVVIELLRSRQRASGDVALALLLYSGIAGGIVMVSLAHSLDASLLAYLFGSIVTVTPGDAATIGVLGLVIVGVVAICGRALFAVVVDEEASRVAGLPVDGLNMLLAVLTAVTVVAAMRVVGVLLVAALLVLPVAFGQVVGRSFRGTMGWAMSVGVVAVVIGLGAARLWGLAPGGTIVLVAAGAYAAVASLAFTGRFSAPWARRIAP
jgi:zinc transport system permease protein